MDGTELLAQCRAGNRVAVEQLVRDYQPQLFRLALSILDDGSQNGSADAQEVTQDALLAALSSPDSYRGEAKLSTWTCKALIAWETKPYERPAIDIFPVVTRDEIES